MPLGFLLEEDLEGGRDGSLLERALYVRLPPWCGGQAFCVLGQPTLGQPDSATHS